MDTAAGKCFLFANSSESICAGRVRCIVSACTLLQPKRTPISAPKRSRGDGRNLRAQRFVPLLGRLPGRGRNPRPSAIGPRFPLPARIGNRDSIPLTYIGYDRAPATLAGTIADRPQTAAAVPKAPVSFLKLLNLKIGSRRFSKADISWCLYPGWPRGGPERWFKVGTAGPTGPTPQYPAPVPSGCGLPVGFFFNLAVCGPVPD